MKRIAVVTQITNLHYCEDRNYIPATFKTEIVTEDQLDLFVSEILFVSTQELAEKVVQMFHYERDEKKSPISLASALELVLEAEKEQTENEISAISQLIASDTYDRLESSVYAAYLEAVHAERGLISYIKNSSSLDKEQKEIRLKHAADIKNDCLKLSREIRSLVKTLKNGEQP